MRRAALGKTYMNWCMVIKPYIRDVLSSFQYEKDEVRRERQKHSQFLCGMNHSFTRADSADFLIYGDHE